MVGFIMMYYDDGNGNDEHSSYGIFKMMIDQHYQGRGLGKEAIIKAIAFCRTFPHGKAKVVELAYKPDNVVAKNLYRSLGFVEKGTVLASGEVAAELVL